MTEPELEEIEVETDPYPKPEKALLTPPQCWERLSLSPRHFWAMLASGRLGLSVLKFGRSTRFSAREFEQWISCSCPDRETWQAMKKCKSCLASFEKCKSCRLAVATEEAEERNL